MERVDIWSEESDPSKRLALLLPDRDINAEILTITVPPRLNELSAKINQARRENPIFFERDTDLKPGTPLPYDPAFGISEEEYRECLSLSKQISLQKTGDVELKIEANGSIVTIRGLPRLEYLKFDCATLTASNPFVENSHPNEFLANENQKVTGYMNGYEWRGSEIPIAGGYFAIIRTAQRQVELDVLIHIHLKDVYGNKDVLNYFVRYPGPEKKQKQTK